MKLTAKLAFLLLFLLTPRALGQDDPLARERLELVTRVAETEIARESVTLAEDGWSSEGTFDVLGTRSGEFAARQRRGEGGRLELEGTFTMGGKTKELDAAFESGALTVTDAGGEPTRRDVEHPDVFFYENLLWAGLVDLGRMLVRLDDAGELEAERAFSALLVTSKASFPVTFKGVEPSPQVVAGRQVQLRVFTVDFAGEVDIEVVCSPSGLPVRIDIPAQLVTVQVVGLEEVRGSRPEPTSIVDTGPWREFLSQPDHDVDLRKAVRVPMRDGVELVADVYLPEGEGPFPTILARTPYSRVTEGALKGGFYARRGYAFVAQDVRGRFDSGGEWFPFVHETRDGSDTLDWIAAQPWSDGRVGMVGASYVGLVQWLAAKSNNPHLVCIVPQVSPPDPQENFPYEGGAFLLGSLWWARVLEAMDTGVDWSTGVDWKAVFSAVPLCDADELLGLERQTFLDVWMQHPPHDLEFWEPASFQGSFGRMSVPAFHVTGWHDGDQPGALQNFAGMRRSARTAQARGGQYLVVGPWTHFFNSSRRLGEVDYGPEGVVDLDARILRFLDHYLKGVDNGIEDEPRVLTFTMGSNRWHGDDDWPLPGTRYTNLYFTSGGDAARIDGDGRLALEPPDGGAASDAFRYDPHDAPEIEADLVDLSGAVITEDRSEDEDRADDLEYSSPPLDQACDLVGPVEVVLWASTDAADTDFSATLYRVSEAGEHFYLCGGHQRLRYASDPLRDRPVPPGTVTKVTIDCWATGQRLEKGERLLVRLSSWSWPAHVRNFNTLEPFGVATQGVVATNTILHDARHPSHVVLPVVPRDDAPGLVFRDE